MPAKDIVGILLQKIFVALVLFLDLRDFYRIKKLKKYLLYVHPPQFLTGGMFAAIILSMEFEDNGFGKLVSFSENLG
ncbi:MAG: hypothetical protein OES14_02715 [Nitrosopumilus sp.]|nr:hypothetical protein [Nitrosopumilus sp.]MDH3824685.1 hypothetical protein [Nitrosopumilus sp.]